MARYTNTWTPGVWEGVGPVLPTAAQDAMSYYQQLLLMVRLINETRENCDKLADFVNEQLEEIVKYLNERIEDFNKSMNTFFEKVQSALDAFKADYEKFKSDMLKAFEQFKSDLLERQEEFERRIDEKIAALEGEWEDMKEEWQTIKSEWNTMKQEWQTFKEELLKAFEDFKAEMKRLWEEYKSQTNESLEDWKEETFNYFLGQYETIKQLLISQLPEVVQQYLPDALKQIVGIALKYNEETHKIDVNYGPGLAVDDQNRLIPNGDSGGGDSIEAGQGISLTDNPGNNKKIVSVKLAAGGNLGFDDDGGLKYTGGTGGDTIVPGQAIEITGEENVKTVNAKIATKDTVGVVKTGDPLVTGITIAADGTISKYKWSAVDVTDDQEIFDSNMENANPWTVDCKYNPEDLQATLYIKLSTQTLEELGLPTNVQITEWAANPSFDYETVPVVSSVSTDDLIGQANCKVTLSSNITGHRVRNGSGNLVFTWTGKENVIKVPFTVTHANMELDETNPIKIDGQAIGSFGNYTFTTLTDKNIVFVMKDGTEVTNIGKLCYVKLTGQNIDIVSENNSCSIQNRESPLLQQKNIVDGIVELKMNPAVFGMSNNDSLQTVLQFYVKYNSAIWDSFKVVSQQEDYNMDNYTSNLTLTLEFPGYHGANFVITSDNPSLIGIGGYLVSSKNVGANSAVTIFAARYGTAQVSITTSYVTSFIKNVDFTVTETNNQPHFAVTTNSTLVGDTGLDIANPKLDNSSYQFSKAQGIITFWIKSDPLNNLFAVINRGSGFKIQASSGQVIAKCETNDFNVIVNDTKTYDFSTLDVGTELYAEFDGNGQVGAYRVKIGQVVD